MPKVSNRCLRRVNHGASPTTSVMLTSAPRKVSFEDTFPDVQSPRSILPEVTPLRPKSTLTRPKSSLSLVELAQSVEAESESSCTRLPLSAPVSPLSSPVSTPNDIYAFQLSSSPWGQFVDMAIPDEEVQIYIPQHPYGVPCSCCLSCRRRRSNPYGDYRSSKEIEPLFLSRTPHSFRLTPRKSREPTEHLCGALDRLQVD